MNENIKIGLDYGTTFQIKNKTVNSGSALTARILMAIVKNGTLIKDNPPSAKTHGYQVWSVPESIATLVGMIGYGVNERTIEQALSGTLGNSKIVSKQEMIRRGLAVKAKLMRKKQVLVSQTPEIMIQLAKNQNRSRGWDRAYIITAKLNTTVKYLIYLDENDIIALVGAPKRNVRNYIRGSQYVALFMNGAVLLRNKKPSNEMRQIMESLEVPTKTPTRIIRLEDDPLVLKSIDMAVPIEALIALG